MQISATNPRAHSAYRTVFPRLVRRCGHAISREYLNQIYEPVSAACVTLANLFFAGVADCGLTPGNPVSKLDTVSHAAQTDKVTIWRNGGPQCETPLLKAPTKSRLLTVRLPCWIC